MARGAFATTWNQAGWAGDFLSFSWLYLVRHFVPRSRGSLDVVPHQEVFAHCDLLDLAFTSFRSVSPPPSIFDLLLSSTRLLVSDLSAVASLRRARRWEVASTRLNTQVEVEIGMMTINTVEGHVVMNTNVRMTDEFPWRETLDGIELKLLKRIEITRVMNRNSITKENRPWRKTFDGIDVRRLERTNVNVLEVDQHPEGRRRRLR